MKIKLIILLAIISGVITVTSAATIVARANGNWSNDATWLGGVPKAGDDVTINAGYKITLDVAATCGRLIVNSACSLTMNADLTVSEMILNSYGTLTVNCNTLTITNGITGIQSNYVFIFNAYASFNNTCCGTLKFTNGGALLSNHPFAVNLGKTVMMNKTVDLGQNANQYNAWNFNCDLELSGMGSVNLGWCKTFTNITLTNTTLNPGNCATISGTLRLNAGGDIVTNGFSWGNNAKLVFNRSYTLNSSNKVWPTGSGTNVPNTVEVLSGTIETNDTFSVKRRLNLLGGTIGTRLTTKIKFLANDTLFKCGGSFGSTPSYGANVTMLYCDVAAGNPPAVIGTEMPSGGFTGDLVISTNVVLGANVSIPSNKNVIVTGTGVLNDSNFAITKASSVLVKTGGIIKTGKSGGLTGTGSLLGSINTTLENGSTVEYNATSGSQEVDVRTDYANLTLTGNAAKNFATGTYEISGDFTVTGASPVLTNTTLNFDGTNQRIEGATFYNLTCSNSGAKTISGNAVVTNVVSVTGTATLNTNNNLTLRSDVNGTASIGPLLSGADITGNICWERFIPGGSGRRRWRFLSMPIWNQSFRNAWQDEIFITGPGTGGISCNFNTTSTASMKRNSNGFDQNQSGAATVFVWNEVTGTWASIPSVFDTINPLKAYRTFVRGNRNIEGCMLLTQMPDSVSDVTIRSCGVPVKFNQSVGLTVNKTTGGGWNYVSNPYPSSVAWNNSTWTAARGAAIDATLYMYDPIRNQYASWHPIAGSVNGGSPVIASGQSFFVKANTATTLFFQESYKTNVSKAGYFGKSATTAENRVSITLIGMESSDEAVLYTYTGALNTYDSICDGYKFGYATGSLAIAKTGSPSTKLAFGALNPLQVRDTVMLFTSLGTTNASYSLSFAGVKNISKMYKYLLRDKFTGETTDLSETSTYDFDVTATTANSYSQTRFELIIIKASSLPVTLTGFNGKKQNAAVALSWATASEKNNSHFVVEHSSDGKIFEAIGTVKGMGESTKAINYNFTHDEPAKGMNYYRLRQVDFNGKEELSQVVAVSFEMAISASASIFPVPAKETINLNLNNTMVQEQTNISITDLLGKTVLTQSIHQLEPAQKITLDISSLQTGAYFMNVDAGGQVQQLKFTKIN